MTKMTMIRSGLFYRRTLRDALRDMKESGRARIVAETRGRWESTFYVTFLPLPECRDRNARSSISGLARLFGDLLSGRLRIRRSPSACNESAHRHSALASASERTEVQAEGPASRAARRKC